MMNLNVIEMIIGIISILFSFGSMVMIISILQKAKVEVKVIKQVLTVVVLLGGITGFLSLYIIYIN